MEKIKEHFASANPLHERIEVALAQSDPDCIPSPSFLDEMLQKHTDLKKYLQRYHSLLHALMDIIEEKETTIPIVADAESHAILTLQKNASHQWEIRALIPILSCTNNAFFSKTQGDMDEEALYSLDRELFEQRMWQLSLQYTGDVLQYDPSSISDEEYLAAALLYFDNEPLKSEFELSELFA